MVRIGASSLKIDYIAQDQGILKLQGYQNFIICSKVIEILLIWWILPIGGVAGLSLQPAQQAQLGQAVILSLRVLHNKLLQRQYRRDFLNIKCIAWQFRFF